MGAERDVSRSASFTNRQHHEVDVPDGNGPEEVRPPVPRRALMLSLGALAVPVYASFAATESAGDQEMLLWLLALVPAFLLAYHRGWRGAALALAAGMGLLATSQVALALSGRGVDNWQLFLAVVVAYISISLMEHRAPSPRARASRAPRPHG